MESKLKLNLDPPNALSVEAMKCKVLKAVKSEYAFNSEIDSILCCIDPTKKNWTPFKVKKAMVDQLYEIIGAKPIFHSAMEKLNALKMLNQAILKQNPEFNNYVNES